MSQEQEPTWQPISALPMLAHVVDGMLDSAEDNYDGPLTPETEPSLAPERDQTASSTNPVGVRSGGAPLSGGLTEPSKDL